MGVYGRRRSERAACASMFTGLAVWVAAKLLLHEPAVPADVAGVAASFAAYVTFARGAAPSPPPAPETPAATT